MESKTSIGKATKYYVNILDTSTREIQTAASETTTVAPPKKEVSFNTTTAMKVSRDNRADFSKKKTRRKSKS